MNYQDNSDSEDSRTDYNAQRGGNTRSAIATGSDPIELDALRCESVDALRSIFTDFLQEFQ